MLTVAVLLVGALMAISETPEILTLTDDTSNDCESVQILEVTQSGCAFQKSANPPPARLPLRPFAGARNVTVHNLSLSLARSPRTLLVLLMLQRK